MRRFARVALWLALAPAGAGCTGSDHHYMQPRPPPAPVCTARQPDRQRPVPGYPGLVLDDASYGGTSSWTHDGDPPAGDRCPRPPPPGVQPAR